MKPCITNESTEKLVATTPDIPSEPKVQINKDAQPAVDEVGANNSRTKEADNPGQEPASFSENFKITNSKIATGKQQQDMSNTSEQVKLITANQEDSNEANNNNKQSLEKVS